ncbi:hypothetical protein GUJ93_ZPchr0001g32073 [Zizania palustris]|uniref:Agenet-like domain-containing protein n=1 Tax=Zizania palustris TaxID=103762 RepID=A0A8J5RV82_ZIZPA|nr:hypothetical protein GUJ93_ZPchr0001g32073 [Zizania palustris]
MEEGREKQDEGKRRRLEEWSGRELEWMKMDLILPFKVGGAAESRTFSPGFRGAWFRCKIIDMDVRKGHMECQLEYIDYPDESKNLFIPCFVMYFSFFENH